MLGLHRPLNVNVILAQVRRRDWPTINQPLVGDVTSSVHKTVKFKRFPLEGRSWARDDFNHRIHDLVWGTDSNRKKRWWKLGCTVFENCIDLEQQPPCTQWYVYGIGQCFSAAGLWNCLDLVVALLAVYFYFFQFFFNFKIFIFHRENVEHLIHRKPASSIIYLLHMIESGLASIYSFYFNSGCKSIIRKTNVSPDFQTVETKGPTENHLNTEVKKQD